MIVSHFPSLLSWLAHLFQIWTPKMQQKPWFSFRRLQQTPTPPVFCVNNIKNAFKKGHICMCNHSWARSRTHRSVINNTGRGCLPPRSRCIVELCGVLVERGHDSCHQSHLLSGHTRDWSWFQNTHTGWTGSPPGVCVCVCNSSGDPSRVSPCPRHMTAGPVL